MIVWLASYPRSGNTFLRIVINRLFGMSTSAIYPVDGVAERLGHGLVGFEELPADLAALRTAGSVNLVKTHLRRQWDVDDGDAAICLVRDGQDAVVSFARQRAEGNPTVFTEELRAAIQRHEGGTGSWGDNVLSWLDVPNGVQKVVMRYEDLVSSPAAVVTEAMAAVAPDLQVIPDAAIPTFAELHGVDPDFFRRGLTDTHRQEMPAEIEDLFWSFPDNTRAMELLGYSRS